MRSAGSEPTPDRDAAEAWFLRRGVPGALSLRARSRHVWSRCAPPIAFYATVVTALLVVYFLIGTSEIYIDGPPTPVERIVLGVIVLTAPIAGVVGWAVSRLRRRQQALATAAALVVACVVSVIQGGPSHLIGVAVAMVVAAVSVVSGLGAVLGWAVRLTMSQVSALGSLLVGALPVMLLTVVVFFNSYAWVLAATITRERMWLIFGLLAAITVAFLASTTISRVRPMLKTADASHDAAHALTGTPFAELPDPADLTPLTRGERFNVVTVLTAAQIANLLMVAASTAGIYFVLGLIALSPEVLAKWTGNGSSDGVFLGMTLPVPQALIHMTLLLMVLTFMYVSGRSVADEEYKRNVLGPLIEDLHITLIARNRYRNRLESATSPRGLPPASSAAEDAAKSTRTQTD